MRFPTYEESVWFAILEVARDGGGTVSLHKPDCNEIGTDTDTSCLCGVEVLRVDPVAQVALAA